MSELLKNHILQKLSPQDAERGHLYVLLDPSRDSSMLTVARAMAEESACLFLGDARREFEDDAPWLFRCDPSGELARFLVQKGFGERWGLFVRSEKQFADLFSHFRKFIKIIDADGDQLFWRFYDPAVIVSQIPFLTGEQRIFFFQGIDWIGIEIGKEALVFLSCNEDGTLTSNTMEVHGDLVEYSENTISDVADIPDNLIKISTIGAAVRPLMRFTQSQIDAPLLYNRPALVTHVIENLDDDFKPVIAKIDEVPLREMIGHGVSLATLSYAIHDIEHVELFIDFMFRIAPGWHRQPTLNKVLVREDLSTKDKFRFLASDEMAASWDDAERYDDPREWLPDDIARQLDANGDVRS